MSTAANNGAPASMRVSTRTPVAVVLSRMDAGPWITAFNDAFAAIDLAAEAFVWTPDVDARATRYAIVWQPPPALFAAAPALRALLNLGAGVESLIDNAAVPVHLPVLRIVDAGMAVKMAEYVCFALARITRGLDRFGPHGERRWDIERPRGKPPTVGVMGLGAIGAPIAERIAAFGYPVIGWSRSTRTAASLPLEQSFAGIDALADFLARANIVVNVLPLTPQTENLLDATRFKQLPAGAHLINVGRGATIVDEDLIAALDAGHLASATLDVFRVEPLPAEHPFWQHARVTVTPHLSGPTPRAAAARQIAENIDRLERGERADTLPGYVDRVLGY